MNSCMEKTAARMLVCRTCSLQTTHLFRAESARAGSWRIGFCGNDPSPGGVAQLVERVLYHSTRRAVPERSWVQSLLPTTEVEPGFSTFGGMLVPVLQLISPVCKTGTSRFLRKRAREATE
jgi:hypothetical protein